jgi:hypothetical protein
MWQATGAPRALFWPILTAGFAYARVWHRLDLYGASPLAAVRTPAFAPAARGQFPGVAVVRSAPSEYKAEVLAWLRR